VVITREPTAPAATSATPIGSHGRLLRSPYRMSPRTKMPKMTTTTVAAIRVRNMGVLIEPPLPRCPLDTPFEHVHTGTCDERFTGCDQG